MASSPLVCRQACILMRNMVVRNPELRPAFLEKGEYQGDFTLLDPCAQCNSGLPPGVFPHVHQRVMRNPELRPAFLEKDKYQTKMISHCLILMRDAMACHQTCILMHIMVVRNTELGPAFLE
eukprot:1041922-Pelagomonas_calceolata.AAC.1